MENVTKNGIVFGVKDNNQKAAFLNSGWKLVEAGADSSPTSNSDQNVSTGSVQKNNNEADGLSNSDESADKQYSRSEIARMSTADLKEVAISLGLEVTEESTGKVLKEQILEKLGL